MSAIRSGRIPIDGEPFPAACALAGALAERGVAALALSESGGWTTLSARITDLPGLVGSAWVAGEAAELVALDRSLRVEIGPDGLTWFTTDGPLADALAPLSESPSDSR